MANDENDIAAPDGPEMELSTHPQKEFEELRALMPPRREQPRDPDAAASLAKHLEAIAALLDEQGPAAAWDVGGHYHTIVTEKLMKRSGERAIRLPGGESTLKLYARVRRAFSKEDVSRYGAVRLDRLLRYRKAAGAVASGDIGSEPIAVPRKDGSLEPKPFADCSERDLNRAARAARRKGSMLDDLAQRVDAAVAGASRGEVHVSLASKFGQPAVKLTPIPVGSLLKVLRALLKAVEEDAGVSGASDGKAQDNAATTLKPPPSTG